MTEDATYQHVPDLQEPLFVWPVDTSPKGAQTGFAALTRAEVRWCLLRGQDTKTAAEGCAEIDILLALEDRQAAAAALRRVGFTELATRGRGSHAFFVRNDGAAGWCVFDVVTRVDFGRWQEATSDLAAGILARCWGDPVPVPSPVDAFWLLALHCVLDVGAVEVRHRPALRELLPVARSSPIPAGVVPVAMPNRALAERVLAIVDAEAWSSVSDVARRAARSRGRSEQALLRLRAARNRAARARFRPRARRLRGLRVALIAPDGAGKSTLIPAVQADWPWASSSRYMGLYPARARPPARWLPGSGMVRRLVRVGSAELGGRRLARSGQLVLLDRHPWDVVLYAHPGSFQARLRRLAKLLMFAGWPAPDLLLVLDAPGTVLHLRQPHLDADSLEQARRGYQRLATDVARAGRCAVATIDATSSFPDVRAAVTAEIWRLVSARAGVRA